MAKTEAKSEKEILALLAVSAGLIFLWGLILLPVVLVNERFNIIRQF